MPAIKEKNHFAAWFVSKPAISGLLVFLLMQSMVSYILYQRYRIIRENDKREMSNLLHVGYNNVEQTLKNSSTVALTLALTINDEGQPENFDLVGRQLLTSNPGIDAVQLVPGGVIKYVYPLEGNEAALNLDILKSAENRAQALLAIRSKKMYFAGPLALKQGGIGIIGRLPVYQDGKFWGFSGIVIHMETLIKNSGLQSIDDSKYYFQFSHKNALTQKEEFFFPVKEDFTRKYYDYVTFPDSDWKLYIITKDGNPIWYQLISLFALGSLLALLFGFLTLLLLRKPAELQLEVLKQTRKLLNSEVKYRTIFEKAAIGIAHVDSNNQGFIDTNGHLCRMLGYTSEEIKGVNAIDISHPDDKRKGMEITSRLLDGDIDNFTFEKRFFSKSGDIIWTNVTISPLWKKGEKPTAHIAIVEDITPKKEAEQQIRETEARFRSLFEDSPVALWEEDFSAVKKYLAQFSDLNAGNAKQWLASHPDEVKKCISLVRIIDVNNECLRLHQPKTKSEILAANLNLLLDDESTEAFRKQLVAVVCGETSIAIDTQIKHLGEGNRDIHLQWSVMRGYEETLERIIISTEDVTAQKEAGRIIMESQQKIESLVNSIDGIVWECSTEPPYRLSFISKKVNEILGFTPEEWAADDYFWEKHIHPEDKKRCLEFFERSITAKPGEDYEYRMIDSKGDIVWFRDSMNVNFENGKPASLRGIMIDITKTKEAEKIILESQQRIESLVNTIDGIVWECDYNTYEFTFVNKKAEEITGYPVSEWLHDPTFWAEKIHPDDREWAIQFCLENSQNRSQYDFEYRMIAKDGSVLWLRDIVNVVYENGIAVSLKGIMIDITKNKEAENDLNASLELVNDQKKRLMNFSYIVSHNLRSHAANIQSITNLIGDADSDEEREEMIGMLRTVSGTLNETMDNLNDLVNVQANVAIAIEPLELRLYAENAQKAISDQIEAKSATIVNNIPENLAVDYNPAYLESIFLNLFSNALRYGHPDRKPVVTAEFIEEDGIKALRITDNGIGIDMTRHGDKLFGLYKTFNGNADARGIGLFLTRSQIEAMGGKISVKSELGKGTTFIIHFK